MYQYLQNMLEEALRIFLFINLSKQNLKKSIKPEIIANSKSVNFSRRFAAQVDYNFCV